MKKFGKRYYVLIFLLAFAMGSVLRFAERNSFRIVQSSTVYAPELEVVTGAEADVETEKINLNEATTLELDALFGIGPELAERIVEYRTKNGKFEEIQDIMKVSGIGEKTYNEIENHIYVE